jgi:hypothetical protein
MECLDCRLLFCSLLNHLPTARPLLHSHHGSKATTQHNNSHLTPSFTYPLPPTPHPPKDHVWIVGSYFHYSVPGGFDAPTARDITAKPKGPFGGAGDPMYVVTATKKLEA